MLVVEHFISCCLWVQSLQQCFENAAALHYMPYMPYIPYNTYIPYLP